jgi:hypothetical protein
MQQVLNDLTRLVGLSDGDHDLLRQYDLLLRPWEPEITKAFYDTLFAYGPTARIFAEGERPAREETLISWYDEVISGRRDEAFWTHQWVVGLVHIPRKVTNPFMLGMMSRVQQIFLAKCLASFEAQEAGRVFGAFKRVTDVVAGLIAEGYFTSYVEALERMNGSQRALTERMVELEISRMLGEIRGGAGKCPVHHG